MRIMAEPEYNEEINMEVTEEKMREYMDNEVDEGDYIEVYFGRCHVEGTIDSKEGTHYRVDTDNKTFGLMEFDIENISRDVLEVAHIPENSNKKIILSVL